MITIYSIINLETNKAYIGKTKDFHTRKRKHLSLLRSGKHFNRKLQHSYNLHGSEIFDFVPLIELDDEDDWEWYEKIFIKLFDTLKNGYNLSEGGLGGNFCDLERNFKQSEANKNRVDNVIQMDCKTLKILNEFRSLNEAGLKTGIPMTSISKACHRQTRFAKGFCWCFKEDYHEYWKPMLTSRQTPILVIDANIDKPLFLATSIVEIQTNLHISQLKIKEIIRSGESYLTCKKQLIRIIKISPEEYYAFPMKKPVSTRAFISS